MSSSKSETVVVLGASNQPERYSYLAVQMLLEHQHTVIPVHPALAEILGLPVVAELGKITQPVDTLTLYLGPERLEKLIPEIVKLHPKRVIFNPGTESASVRSALDAAGIAWLEACTLVLLRTGQF
jgi:predicted CoA-binding protein